MHPNVKTTTEEIEAALESAKKDPPDVFLVSATYHPEKGLDLFIFTLSNGRRMVFPRENLQPVANATPAQAADVVIQGLGYGVWWPQVDSGLRLDSLREGRTGNDQWMARYQQQVAIAA